MKQATNLLEQPRSDRLQILIITGEDHFHHRWRACSYRLREVLEEKPQFEVRITEAFDGASAQTLERFDAVILNYFGAERPMALERRWGNFTEQALFDYVRNGGGLVASHAAFWMGATWDDENGAELVRLFGGAMRPTSRRGPGDNVDIHITQPDHPITRGLALDFVVPKEDKYVNLLVPADNQIEVLAETTDPAEAYLDGAYYAINAMPGPKIFHLEEARRLVGVNRRHPMCWTKRYGQGRVFALCFGHVGAATPEDAHRGREEGREIGPTVDAATRIPEFKAMLTRGAEWAATGKVLEFPAERPRG